MSGGVGHQVEPGLTHASRRDTLRRRAGSTLVAVLALALLIGSEGPMTRTAPDLRPDRSDGPILGFDDASAATLARGTHLSLSSKVLKGPLVPGVTRKLRVTVKNPFPFGVRVTVLSAHASQISHTGCRTNWIAVKAFKASKKHHAVLVRARRQTATTLTIRMVNLTTVNQDACKGATFHLALRAKATRA
ncbi:MAG: hypothetical protein WAN48_09740 [Actinomycetes bacterium]